ncbi:MAG TPA: VOC family protein [Stellaceae bacterium]|jgi:catechol 2,3-dioxygenase-like lactoylglutathione lyase family enzyme|nr:VOC family protein [Stellaceae bacterium]
MPDTPAARKYDVGGLLLDRPFKIRRLGHFGFDNLAMAESLTFYTDLLGFRLSDILDFNRVAHDKKTIEGLGDTNGYMLRYGTDHHAFALFPRRVRAALNHRANTNPEVTTNQITFQVGSLREVVEGHDYFKSHGIEIQRAGRDPLGSNWHTYVYDPDDHVAELYYGIEQVGWDGLAKPEFKVSRPFFEVAQLPQPAEREEIRAAADKGVDLSSGHRGFDALPAKYEVGGVMLPRPFKIVRIGPVRLFARDMDKAEAFYRDQLGLLASEEIVWEGERCVFLRCNTEHHTVALYPIALREKLGVSPHSNCMSFGLQLGSYRQLRDAIDWLKAQGARIIELAPALRPGIDYAAYAIDPDGHALELYYYMEQIGWDGRVRGSAARRKVKQGLWPDTLEPLSDTYMGEPFLGPLG